MKKAYFILTLAILPVSFFGSDYFPAGARSTALGNSSVALTDAWCTANNQAGLAFVRNTGTCIYYENRFLLKELSTRSAALVMPLKTGTLGLSLHNFGYALYQENKYNVSFAKCFSDAFSIGMALDYLQIHSSEENTNLTTVAGEVGLLVKLRKDLLLGAHVYNPTRAKLGKNTKERVPTLMRLGINYSFSSRVLLVMETEKDLSEKARFKAGIEYQPLTSFYLRAGISTSPMLSSFGVGIHLKNFQIDLSASFHQTLGTTPQLGLTYQFTKNKKTDRDNP